MKVKELIEELKKMDQNLEVVSSDCEWGYFLVNKPKVMTNIVTGGFFGEKEKKYKKVVEI